MNIYFFIALNVRFMGKISASVSGSFLLSVHCIIQFSYPTSKLLSSQ